MVRTIHIDSLPLSSVRTINEFLLQFPLRPLKAMDCLMRWLHSNPPAVGNPSPHFSLSMNSLKVLFRLYCHLVPRVASRP